MRHNKAINIIKDFEGFRKYSYPDPASPMYETLLKLVSPRKVLVDADMIDPKINKFIDENPKISALPWTIGYGYTIGVKRGDIMEEPKAYTCLVKEVEMVASKVVSYIPEKVELNENQLSALISLAYNIGLGAFKNSTLLKYLKENKKVLAGKEILVWHKAGGKPNQILIKRRITEFNLYEELV